MNDQNKLFVERELLDRREIETKSPKSPKCYPITTMNYQTSIPFACLVNATIRM